MAECEVYDGLHFRMPNDEDAPSVTAIFSSTMPSDFFDRDRALRFFEMGGPDHQLGGLINIGYNCYINTVIQCLAYTPGFMQFCLNLPNVMYQANSGSAFFLDSFAHIFSELTTNKSMSPTWLLTDSGLIRETFRRPIQQDAHEYLLDLLDVFEKECTRAFADSQGETMISHFFSGELSTLLECHHCHACVSRKTKFHDITIPITEYENLNVALEAIMSSSRIEITGLCETCQSEGQLTKTNEYTKLPLVLIITLLRFDNLCKKIEDFFEFQKTLVVGDAQYELYAMILHDGRLISHGHFVAYVMDQQGGWYKADDVCIYRLKEEVVMSSCPYVLFYKRVNV